MLPDSGDLVQVEVQHFLLGHELEALAQRLHHSVFDPVVDHLREMPRAGRPHQAVALVRAGRQRLEDGLPAGED